MKNDQFGTKLGATGRSFVLLIIGLLFHTLPLHAQTSGTIWWTHGGSIDAATIYAISVKDGTGYIEMEHEGKRQWFSGLLSVQFNENGAPRLADGSRHPQMGNLVSEATFAVQPTPTLTIHERYSAIQRRQIEQTKKLAAEREAGEYSQSEETASETAFESMDRIYAETQVAEKPYVERPVYREQPPVCPVCGGSGRSPCSRCNPESYQYRKVAMSRPWNPVPGLIPCLKCNQTSWDVTEKSFGQGDLVGDYFRRQSGISKEGYKRAMGIKCPRCGGVGGVSCPDCDGEGYVLCPNCNGRGTLETSSQETGNPPVMTRDEFRRAVIGKTPYEVINTLGEPDSTQNDGKDQWMYYHARTKDPITGKVEDLVQVLFDRGRVRSVSFF